MKNGVSIQVIGKNGKNAKKQENEKALKRTSVAGGNFFLGDRGGFGNVHSGDGSFAWLKREIITYS
jgi:hypothetical protein